MDGPSLPDRVVGLRAARQRYGSLVDELLPALMRADPLADALAADFVKRPRAEGHAMLGQALRDGIDKVAEAPDSLRALFAQIDRPPDWVDWAAVERAGETLFRTGFAGGTVLGTKSLMTGYVSPAGNKPLVMSGQLRRRERIGFRLAETSRFVVDVCSRGGMRRHGPGFASTVRVRVMHAAVRHLIARSGQWKPQAWGAPINQHDMVGTTLLFSGAFLQGLREFGFEISAGEAGDYMMLWRLNGWLIGVEPELLPTDEQAGTRLAEVIRMTQADPDDDARALVHAMIRSPLHTAPGDPRSQRSAARQVSLGWGFARVMLGDELADKLEIPRDVTRYVLPGIRRVISRAERAGRFVPGYRQACIRAGRRYWEQAIRMGLAGQPASFVPPSVLEGLGLRRSAA